MIRVKVESCWGGGEKYYFRITTPGNARETIRGEKWTRKVASEALNLLENVYHYDRAKIRFIHV